MALTEDQIANLLSNLLRVTENKPDARKTAVRWFNRLYYDFKRWSDTTFASIRSHKVFVGKPSPAHIKDLRDHLRAIRDSLFYASHLDRFERSTRNLPIHELQSEFCDNLAMLTRRFERDFNWLLKEDPDAYHQLNRLIGEAEDFPGYGLSIFRTMFTTFETLSKDLFYKTNNKLGRKRLSALLDDYEKESQRALQGLHKVAREARITLLDINEYQSILDTEGSANSNVLVIGEVTISHDTINVQNVIGPVNIKSRFDRVAQTVTNAPALPENEKTQLADLIQELKKALVPVGDKQPENAQQVLTTAEMVAAEVSKQKPNKSFLVLMAKGLKEAAKAVSGIAPSVLDVAIKIVDLVGKLS